MKLVVLHGSAINSSRQKLLEIKKKFPADNIIIFDKEAEEKDIIATLQTTSLFGDDKLIIYENPPDNFFVDSSLITHRSSLILWFDHEIDIKNWQGAEVLFFPESKEISVFPLLDLLGQKDSKAFLELEKLKREYDSQYLITMIFYLLRNLVVTPKGAKDFVKNKNIRMRKNFSTEELINMYQFVLNTDFKIKSGLMGETQGEFLLVNLFLH